MLYDLLFPELKGCTWGYVNFGEEARATKERLYGGEWVGSLHRKYEMDFSYGGYMEDRNHLWRDTYLEPGCAWHLGVDYQVPIGTAVHLPVDAMLFHSRVDPDNNGGWGGQVIVRIPDESPVPTAGLYVIFGHLDGIPSVPRDLRKQIPMKAGDCIGYVADRTKNGNWFPHLHVQAMREKSSMRIIRGGKDCYDVLEEVDGYSPLYAGIDDDFPRPETMLGA